ncbi:MAG: DUF2203 domain-containing protein [Planctomycetota bacterium]
MKPRRFTPAQAGRTLPLVRRIVADLLDRGRQLRDLATQEEDAAVLDAMGHLQEEIQEFIEELEALGCYYKDWSYELGMVDFPAVIDGKNVLLSWRGDEDAVTHYHEYDSGAQGRKPIPPELLVEENDASNEAGPKTDSDLA